jgi:hypothetical protein
MHEMSPNSTGIADEDPTLEDEAPDFEPSTADTPGDERSVVAAGGNSVGAIEHDERGEARWKWVTETATATEIDKTFDHLEALSNASLSLEDTAAKAATEKPSRKTGYNPYDLGGSPPSKSRK